jgi:hypothetical protein
MTAKRPPRQRLAKDPDARLEGMLQHNVEVWLPQQQLEALDPRNLDYFIDSLSRTETATRNLRNRLEAIRDGVERTCPVCGRPVAGRSDAIYCESNCRIRAHREAKRNG